MCMKNLLAYFYFLSTYLCLGVFDLLSNKFVVSGMRQKLKSNIFLGPSIKSSRQNKRPWTLSGMSIPQKVQVGWTVFTFYHAWKGDSIINFK